MNLDRLDSIILGHNPFFGVDHLSQQRGNSNAQRFEDAREMLDMLAYCHALGIRGMMMSTHSKARVVSELLGEDQRFASAWRIYPLVPYLHKYIHMASTKGLTTMIGEALMQGDVLHRASVALQAGRGILKNDIRYMLTSLIDFELMTFKGRRLGAVFLHDGLTDLALGLEAVSALELFRDHVVEHYGVPAGFATKNLPLLRRVAERRGWTGLLAMASFNRVGFCVNPSPEECEAAIRRPGMAFVAMNTLAGGAITPESAYQYLGRIPEIHSVVVGMSHKDHAKETVEMIRKYLPCAAPVQSADSTRS